MPPDLLQNVLKTVIRLDHKLRLGIYRAQFVDCLRTDLLFDNMGIDYDQGIDQAENAVDFLGDNNGTGHHKFIALSECLWKYFL